MVCAKSGKMNTYTALRLKHVPLLKPCERDCLISHQEHAKTRYARVFGVFKH